MNPTFITVLASLAIALPLSAGAAPKILQGATVNIKENKATNVKGVGGSLSASAGALFLGLQAGPQGSLDMSAEANVNSVVMRGDAEIGGTVNLERNEATDIMAIGGRANVNSLIMEGVQP